MIENITHRAAGRLCLRTHDMALDIGGEDHFGHAALNSAIITSTQVARNWNSWMARWTSWSQEQCRGDSKYLSVARMWRLPRR
jgi:hypothetical protein